jgi:short-subunit dehydrogenase
MAVYYASKAYILSFTEALAEELSATGVTVTCLCPGPVKTNFQRRAYLEGTGMVNSPLTVDVRVVAREGYEGMKQGKRIVIPGWKNRMGVELLRVSPRSVVTKVVRKLQEKKDG